MIRVADLETMDRAALAAAWLQVFGQPAPRRLSAPLMRRLLAFEVQVKQHGDLPKSTRRALEKTRPQKPRATAPGLKPGGRLLRDWNGRTHIVEVTGEGYLYQGHRYRSLSAIAREITGAHWSGPRFFGLKGATR